MIGFSLLVLLFLVLALAGPWWPYSRGWGYTPAAVALALLLAWFVAIWLGWIALAWPWIAVTPAPPVAPAR